MEDLLIKKTNWSIKTANDAKHRLQISSNYSSTVRREWNRYPQEAHILNIENSIYRRLQVNEISKIQTFPEEYFNESTLKSREIIAGLGNAVAPDLAKVIFQTILDNYALKNKTSIDICAGIGGLSLGLPKTYEHLCLVDFWKPSIDLLKTKKHLWSPKNVHHADLKKFDFGKYNSETGFLIGGPPCQPYSNAGSRQGQDDERDLMAYMPQLIGTLRPEVFILENVPGLISPKFSLYFNQLMKNLEEPKKDLIYGVSFQTFNTLDYDIAQSRKRVFIVGLLNAKNIEAAQLLNKITERKSKRGKSLFDIGVGKISSTDEWFDFNGDLEYYKFLDRERKIITNQLELF